MHWKNEADIVLAVPPNVFGFVDVCSTTYSKVDGVELEFAPKD